MLRACERVCGVPCNLKAAQDQDAQQNAAMDRAVLITREEVAHWEHGMAIRASAVAVISAAGMAAAAREAAAADERREAESAARQAATAHEACAGLGAIAEEEADVTALEGALAQESAPGG